MLMRAPIEALRHMRAAVFASLALVALAPSASACSWVVPELLQDLEWHPALGIVGTTELFWRGVVDRENGTVRSTFPGDAVISPDGRYVAFPRAGPDVQAGPMRIADSCGGHLSRHLVGWDRANDSFAMVDEGPIWSMGAREEGVVTYRERETRVFAWGDWRTVSLDGGATGATPLSWRGGLPDPALAPLKAQGVWNAARSPDGRFAAAWVELEGGGSEIRVYRLDDVELVARADAGNARARLAWGPTALAVLLWPIEGSPQLPTLRVYRDAERLAEPEERAFAGERLGGLAWSPAGDRIAVSLLGGQERARLVILDERLGIGESRDVGLEAVEAERMPGLASVPIPEYSLVEKVQATPSAGLVALLVALATARMLRRAA